MKSFCFTVLLCVTISWHTSAYAQGNAPSVVSGGGGQFVNDAVTLDWTLGETAVAVRRSPILVLAEGFQQPALHVVTTEEPDLPYTISLHPNPTRSTVRVTLLGLDRPAQLRLYNLLGEVFASERVQQGSSVVNLSLANRASGLYMLLVLDESGKRLAQYKIIKAE